MDRGMTRVPEKRLQEIVDDFGEMERLWNRRIIFITNKRKVVAHAEWQGSDIVVTKLRRPEKTKLQVGQVLYEGYRPPPELPPRPEIRVDGWRLIRNAQYDSTQAAKPDPFWEEYEGWFLIPDKINGGDGLEEYLFDYPELLAGDTPSYRTLELKELNADSLRMAAFSEVDAYVCGRTEQVPALLPFVPPKTNEVVLYRPSVCSCGCGNFEGWHRYWENKWIVYVPRAKSPL
ncbi:hypothetical protein A2348_05525 [Candidatus Uhrbacteria bacterium RIFOXYB12_FULL_58_10]|uniref:Uncharacterized protein n=1 Tax=Candidatus Uhrbacteria bacterium RIFOXYB2_FULL_57_15 TaxID=1802422 RepID=A0A1F7W7X3_9BACT|nr:MAG: hypothetical protein A2348_05525 [Candidatus Uhrbacteria bacterium RIFOXYB12_FULL_58_10]OGL98880.1 MAG: hypothetical protein A2304_03970 [Candidatus Uhrbacteria bacterium RIFOXYB2_FULL_57_15]